MASSRVDNGARIVDYTRWREVPALTMHPQNPAIHELPVYLEIQSDASGRPVLGFAMHGPQEPLEIGVESPTALPDKGINPVTGLPRLQFEAARPVPYVHSVMLEWWDSRRATYFHWEGGVRIHQVANKRVWYPKSGYSDDGTASANPVGQFIINSEKVIFVQRLVTDAAGAPVVVASCTNWLRPGVKVAGGPCRFKVTWNGTTHYPMFVDANGRDTRTLMVAINEAKFNPGRWPLLSPFVNRQGMVADAAGFHGALLGLTVDDLARPGVLSPAWNEWSAGDELPLADTPAGIQH